MDELALCLRNEKRRKLITGVHSGMCPTAIIPAAQGKITMKTGRWGRVLLRTNVAVKVQKVFCHEGKFRHVEWRGGTKVTLDIFQEVTAAKMFGRMRVAPVVSKVILAKRIPHWVDYDSKADLRGVQIADDKVWNLIIVMERLTGTLRDALVMSADQKETFWKKVDVPRVANVVRGLVSKQYEHNDVRLDNVGYKTRANGSIKLYALDFGYGKVSLDGNLLHRIKKRFGKVLLQAGAPSTLVRQMNFVLANPLLIVSKL